MPERPRQNERLRKALEKIAEDDGSTFLRAQHIANAALNPDPRPSSVERMAYMGTEWITVEDHEAEVERLNDYADRLIREGDELRREIERLRGGDEYAAHPAGSPGNPPFTQQMDDPEDDDA